MEVARLTGVYWDVSCEGAASEVKTMKTKTWKVITNTGKQADLDSGLRFKADTHQRKRFHPWAKA